jgi:hypothetical protein
LLSYVEGVDKALTSAFDSQIDSNRSNTADQ